ncbi:pyrroline-5-carboxylate reductase [Falsarthrobacter nasiphocae]|uniref:Pyrroline-5-carboxylate reductase n=1 Tax=Falsarthrobacter nasiphocae TaxID=189863 RepID=A0AAE3YIG7_9MICC|nr:pyrroline-5-carboxylate reductase [Falsarthrobacter nasiphocae]MDR6892366.1 pyrroline-5-carboxylate reductase [Falsarthrobacter nasiphocae]
MTDSKNIAFLGTGNMNGAILRGVLSAGFPSSAVRATTNSASSASALAEETGVDVLAASEHPEANRDLAGWADVVVLGVKPKGIVDLCREIAPALRENTVVVSVAAGVTLAMMEKALPDAAIIRCMPNTPSTLQMGVLSISPNARTTDAQIAAVASVLGAAGEVVRIPEEQINALIAVSGSGPAFAFYLAEAMADTGAQLGLDPALARKLAALTVRGAGAMLGQNHDAAALRKAVTSPGGTTDRAITTFDEKGVREGIAAGQRACAEKASDMERELGGAEA